MIFPFFGAAAENLPPQSELNLATGIVGPTALYTDNGPVPAEHLVPGDRIARRGCGPATVLDVRFLLYTGPMVRVAPDTLGRARPESFVLLPPDQCVQMRTATGADRDGIFPVRDLVDGQNVRWLRPDTPVRLVRLFFGETLIVHAGGLELEIPG